MNFETFAEGFRSCGGSWVFGIPGGGPSLQLMDTLEKRGARLVATGHESTAVLMAGAVGRFSSKPALSISIKGPGFINTVPALLCNSYEGYPMIGISEAYSTTDPSGRRHKWLAHEQVAGPFLRGFTGFRDKADFFSDCWNLASRELPGPVHVDLSDAGQNENSLPARLQKPLLEVLSDKIRKPILIAGSAVLRNAKWQNQVALLKIPVFTTVSAKGLIDESGAWSAGIYTGDGSGITAEKIILPQADKVICLGVNAGEVLSPKAPHAKTVFIDSADQAFPSNPSRNNLTATDEDVLSLLQKLATFEWGANVVQEALEKTSATIFTDHYNPAASMRVAMEILPDAVHVTDTGNFTVVAEHVLRSRTKRDFLGTPNGRFMGAGLGYALGVALTQQERPVLLWIGDGGLRSYFSELALAAEHPSRLCVLVMEDGYFGSIMGRAKQLGLTETPLSLKPRNYLRAAEGLGLNSARVDSIQELRSTLEAWKRAPGLPLIVGCRFDPEVYRNQAQLLR